MKTRLNKIADFRSGYLFRGRVEHDPCGNVQVVQVKDVVDRRRVETAGLDRVRLDKPEPHLVERGDVLFLGRGHRLYAVVVPEITADTIATGYFFVLRPRLGVVTPEYLVWVLNEAGFQESLSQFVRGTHIPMVSRKDVEQQTIPVPPLEVQQRITNLTELAQRERQLASELADRRERLVEAVARRLAHG
ncbi:MAG: restriction endonuclease subunit S [Lacipirellulaceae bacterium]